MLCKAYHSDKQSQDQLDASSAHYTETGKLPANDFYNAIVDKSDTIDAQVYVKYSLMSQAKLESELVDAGVIVSDKNIKLATHSLPTAVLAVPGTARTQRYWIFPHVKSDMPVLKVSAGCRIGHSWMVLGTDENAYSQHGQDSFKHLANEPMLDIDETQLMHLDAFKYSLDPTRPPVDGTKWEKGRAAAVAKRANTSSPALTRKAPKSSTCSQQPENQPNMNSSQTAGAASPSSIVAADLQDVDLSDKQPKTLREQDEDEPASDAETTAALDVLRLNRGRCNLWRGAIHGADGNWRWQCERAAGTQRQFRNDDIANKLDLWTEKYKKVDKLSAEKIMKCNTSEVDAAIDILMEEYDEIPLEIFPRLVAKKGSEVRDTCKQGDYEKLLTVTFPWCLISEDTPFQVSDPKSAHMVNSLDEKITIFKQVVFSDGLKSMILEKGGSTKNAFKMCEATHSRCQGVLNQREFQPPPLELQAMTDIATACRFVMGLISPDLLSDSIYIDALSDAAEHVKASCAGKSCLSMAAYWVDSSVELKKPFNDNVARLDALQETSKRVDAAQEELQDVIIDLNREITLESIAEYSKAICKGLKAVAYSHGAQVGMVASVFSGKLPAHTVTLFEACKRLLKGNNHNPSKIMPHIVTVVSECSVVLPLNKQISELEVDLGLLQRSNEMNSRRHEWSSATSALTKQVSVETLGQVDAAVKKFEGANFFDDKDLKAGAAAALDAFLLHCIESFPKAPAREDIVGFTKDIQQFIDKDPSTSTECEPAQCLAVFLVAGRVAYTKMTEVISLDLSEKLTLLDPLHDAAQQALLASQHATKHLSELIMYWSVTPPQTNMKEWIAELLERSSKLVVDAEKAVQDKLKFLETVGLETLEASSAVLEPIKYGLAGGKSYKDGMPPGKTWSKWKSHIEATLGQSEVAATLDEQIKSSDKVFFMLAFGPGP